MAEFDPITRWWNVNKFVKTAVLHRIYYNNMTSIVIFNKLKLFKNEKSVPRVFKSDL